MTSSEAEEGAVNLVGATKNPMVVGRKIFIRAVGIPRDEDEVILVVLAMVVGSKWKRSRFKWDLDLPVILDRRFKMERATRWLIGSPSI